MRHTGVRLHRGLVWFGLSRRRLTLLAVLAVSSALLLLSLYFSHHLTVTQSRLRLAAARAVPSVLIGGMPVAFTHGVSDVASSSPPPRAAGRRLVLVYSASCHLCATELPGWRRLLRLTRITPPDAVILVGLQGARPALEPVLTDLKAMGTPYRYLEVVSPLALTADTAISYTPLILVLAPDSRIRLISNVLTTDAERAIHDTFVHTEAEGR